MSAATALIVFDGVALAAWHPVSRFRTTWCCSGRSGCLRPDRRRQE